MSRQKTDPPNWQTMVRRAYRVAKRIEGDHPEMAASLRFAARDVAKEARKAKR